MTLVFSTLEFFEEILREQQDTITLPIELLVEASSIR
jgi:hypothetical protein